MTRRERQAIFRARATKSVCLTIVRALEAMRDRRHRRVTGTHDEEAARRDAIQRDLERARVRLRAAKLQYHRILKKHMRPENGLGMGILR